LTAISPNLVDDDARKEIVAGHDKTLFVDAGAGTGKTTKLVERVVEVVASGYLGSIANLAAITFTENAATELRTRIREKLEDAARSRDGIEQERCVRALRELDDAAITTLHGFAARLLMDAPLEAGLPPGFGIEDEVRASIARDRWWRSQLDDWLDDPSLAEVWRIAFTLGLKLSDLESLVTAFDSNWDLLENRPFDAAAVPAIDSESILAPLRELVAYAADQAPEDDGLARHIETVITPLLREASAESDPLQVLQMVSVTRITSGAGSKAVWDAAGLNKLHAVDLAKAANDACTAQLSACRVAVTTVLVERLRQAVIDHAAARQRGGHLWFHDLLVLAVGLLRNNGSIRAAMHDRWRAVLVDEFQDTDPLQVDLVHLIAGTGDGDWQLVDVPGGGLFFVGDPKQSIYRFRRAEVGLFGDVRSHHGKPECLLTLRQNFRSRPTIIDAVNAVFQDLLGDDPEIPYVELHANRAEVSGDAGPDVLLLGGSHAANMAIVREAEAEHVAVTLRRAHETWTVSREEWDERPPVASYADMAILVPTRTSLSALEDALDRQGVPYRIMSRSLVWQTDAVRDLITVLQAIDDPTDVVAVVAALRHPMFACSDDELSAWAVAGGGWRYDVSAAEELTTSPVAEAMTALNRYHRLRWWLPVNALLDRILRERRAVELTSVHRRPRDHWRRVRFVVDQARAFLDSGGAGLTGFLRWANEQIEGGADAIETATPERDDDAVQILTIHGAKGLEFPVVALTGIHVGPMDRVKVIWSAEAAPEVRLRKGFDTQGFEGAKPDEKAAEDAEDRRLLYVGMTRAMDHLVVSLHHKEKKNGVIDNHAMLLSTKMAKMVAAGAVHEVETPSLPDSGEDGEHVPPASPLSPADREAFIQRRRQLIAHVRKSLPTTATGLVAEREAAAATAEDATDEDRAVDATQEPVDPVDAVSSGEAADAPVPRPVARSGATLGSAVHRALELVDLATDSVDEIRRACLTACAEGGVPQLVDEIEARVRSALTAPIVQEAAHRRSLKEVPIVAELDGRIVEGFIDLVLERADGLVVVDYKTDAVRSQHEQEAKVAHYAPQLRAYAAALSAATGRPVAGAQLLFCGRTAASAVDVPLLLPNKDSR
jgi:ATP-dependent helicase/nuclease subunit A